LIHRSIGSEKRFAFYERAIARPLSKKRKRISDERLGLPENFFWTTAEVFSMKNYSPQRPARRSRNQRTQRTQKRIHRGDTEYAEIGLFLDQNSLLRALSASAVSLS
jgi:hypothetical protein